MSGFWDDAEIIHAYTRAQAIEDGALIEVDRAVAEAGFRYPTALTVGAWAEAVEWSGAGWQDEAGRLWDVLTMARWAARSGKGSDRRVFTVLRVPNRPRCTVAREMRLVLHIGPGDTVDPVLTIMLEGED